MFKRRSYETRAGRLVEEFHSASCPPPEGGRAPRKGKTPEEMRKNNLRRKRKQVKLLLMENFSPGDYHTILTYAKDQRPGSLEECKADLRKLLRKLRGVYKRKEIPLKWVANIECGKLGAWHIHLVINRTPDLDMELNRAWPHGRPRNVLIREKEGLPALAEYVSKESTGPGGERIVATSHSRNLRFPKAKEKEIKRWETWKQQPRIPKGYYLDKRYHSEWIDAGGYPHREYILIREDKNAGSPSVRGSRGQPEGKGKKARGLHP